MYPGVLKIMVIGISSVAGKRAYPLAGMAYATSKFGVTGMATAINAGCTKALEAQEFSLKGLRKHIESHSVEQQSFTFVRSHT